jgi:hypothetical protein
MPKNGQLTSINWPGAATGWIEYLLLGFKNVPDLSLFRALFRQRQLTGRLVFVILMGFARKSEEFCPAEAMQVVCNVDDGPKTDWVDGF